MSADVVARAGGSRTATPSVVLLALRRHAARYVVRGSVGGSVKG